MDQPMFSVVAKGTDEKGEFMQIVVVHHDENRGNGDPNEAFFAVSASGLPGGSIPVMTRADFSSVAEQHPWLADKVNHQFDHAKKIHDARKVATLKGIRKVTADFLRKALDVVTA